MTGKLWRMKSKVANSQQRHIRVQDRETGVFRDSDAEGRPQMENTQNLSVLSLPAPSA